MALLAWLRELARGPEDDTALAADFAESVVAREDETKKDWLVSSIDLHAGLEVTEQPMSTVPGELRDELMKPHCWRDSV